MRVSWTRKDTVQTDQTEEALSVVIVVIIIEEMSVTSKLSIVLVVLVAFIAYLVKVHPDIIVVVLPQYLDGYFVRWLYARDKTNGIASGHIPMTTKILPQKISVENLADIIHKDAFPIHVKKVVDIDEDAAMNALIEANTGRSLRLFSYANWTEPHFSPSCSKTRQSRTAPFDDYARSHLLANNSENHSYDYAGFEAITDADTLLKMTNIDWSKIGSYKQNNLFTSNFPHEILTAPFHCAPIDSISMQLLGSKTWLFVSPEDLNRFPNVPLPTSFNLPMTDEELLSKIKNIYVVKAEPGDLIYFGPNWCHAVYTSEGRNLMFTLRYNAQKKLRDLPTLLLYKIVYRFKTRQFAGLPQDNAKMFPILYDDLNGYFSNCGVSDTLQKIYDNVMHYL